MKTYTVYKHTSPSGKVYIGITYNTLRDRAGANGHRYKNRHFSAAIQKYGWDNFSHEIVAENLSYEWACKLEKILIAKYRSNNQEFGYNISEGGEGGFCGGHHTEETKRHLSEINKGENNHFYGKHHTKETLDHIRAVTDYKALGKKVSQANRGKSAWNKGLKWSDETRAKMSASLRGRVSPNKGKTLSEETKRKISEAHLGKPAPNKGQPMSEEQKQKLSESRKQWYAENGVSDETREKLRQAMTGRELSEEHRQKIGNALRGRKYSEETKQKMREAALRRWQNKK